MLLTRRESGVTLIEVNLAMGVLLFGILSVASLFPTGLQLAEYGYRSTDAALISSMARSQIEILSRSKNFKYPDRVPAQLRSEPREARLKESVPESTKNTYNKFVCKPVDGKPNESVGWSPNAWGSTYVLITSGAEAGRIFGVLGNDASSLTIKENVAGMSIRVNDTIRIIYNKKGLCIPESFLRLGKRVPTINATEMEWLEPNISPDRMTLDRIAKDTASMLEIKRTSSGKLVYRYSYGILFDGPEPNNPDLFRAYVLIYKDFDNDLGTQWWKGNAPVEYSVIFYRRPSAIPE